LNRRRYNRGNVLCELRRFARIAGTARTFELRAKKIRILQPRAENNSLLTILSKNADIYNDMFAIRLRAGQYLKHTYIYMYVHVESHVRQKRCSHPAQKCAKAF
jgi:hypothetical protein